MEVLIHLSGKVRDPKFVAKWLKAAESKRVTLSMVRQDEKLFNNNSVGLDLQDEIAPAIPVAAPANVVPGVGVGSSSGSGSKTADGVCYFSVVMYLRC